MTFQGRQELLTHSSTNNARLHFHSIVPYVRIHRFTMHKAHIAYTCTHCLHTMYVCSSVGLGPTTSNGKFGDVCLAWVQFRLFTCKGHVWYLDTISLICTHSHEDNGNSSKLLTVRSTVLVFAASPLKMGSNISPTSLIITTHFRDVFRRESVKERPLSGSLCMGS